MSGRLMALPRTAHQAAGPSPSGGVLVRRSWLSLAFYPVSFVAGFVVDEVVLSWYGYSENESAPLWVGVAAAGPALLILSMPGIFAVLFGRRAMRQGNRDGRVPAVIGAAIALGVVALNILTADSPASL